MKYTNYIGVLCWLYNMFFWGSVIHYPYPSGLLHGPWSNHIIVPMSEKQPWMSWWNQMVPNHSKTQQSVILVHDSEGIIMKHADTIHTMTFPRRTPACLCLNWVWSSLLILEQNKYIKPYSTARGEWNLLNANIRSQRQRKQCHYIPMT